MSDKSREGFLNLKDDSPAAFIGVLADQKDHSFS